MLANKTETSVRVEQRASILGCTSIRGAPRSQSQQSGCTHYQPRVKASHHSRDELPMGYKSGEKEGGENHEIRTASLGTKAEVPRIQYNIRGMVPRLRSRAEGVGRK